MTKVEYFACWVIENVVFPIALVGLVAVLWLFIGVALWTVLSGVPLTCTTTTTGTTTTSTVPR